MTNSPPPSDTPNKAQHRRKENGPMATRLRNSKWGQRFFSFLGYIPWT